MTHAQDRAKNPTVPAKSGGHIKVKRFDVTTTGGEINVPAGIKGGWIENCGASDIAFNFNDDAQGDYWLLKPGGRAPELRFNEHTKLNLKALQSDGQIQCLYWG